MELSNLKDAIQQSGLTNTFSDLYSGGNSSLENSTKQPWEFCFVTTCTDCVMCSPACTYCTSSVI